MAKTQVQTRPIYEIANDIIRDHKEQGRSLYFGAVPYVEAMQYLDKVTDYFGEDDAVSVLTYAVSNLGTWKGETARAVKKEIKAMLPW